MFGGFESLSMRNSPASMPVLMYASPSARCQASSPSDRPPASGRKSYCDEGSAFKSLIVLSASRSHSLNSLSSSLTAIGYLLGMADVLGMADLNKAVYCHVVGCRT